MGAAVRSIRVEPSGFEFPVAEGENVFAAAHRAGLRWPTVCYGQARCTACAVELLDGHRNTVPAVEPEPTALEQLAGRYGPRRDLRDVRLACQLRVTGDVVVRKPGVKRLTAEDES